MKFPELHSTLAQAAFQKQTINPNVQVQLESRFPSLCTYLWHSTHKYGLDKKNLKNKIDQYRSNGPI